MNGELCSKCKTKVSLNYHRYCYTCLRIMSGRSVKPKFHRDPNNKTMCSKCKVKPRLPYHRYCQGCKNQSTTDWIRARGGDWKSRTPEQKRKAVVRRYAGHQVKRKNIVRTCVICDQTPAEIHHWDYEQMTKNWDFLCRDHHTAADKLQKKGLTKEQIMEYLVNSVKAGAAVAPPQ